MAGGFFGGIAAGQQNRAKVEDAKKARELQGLGLEQDFDIANRGLGIRERRLGLEARRVDIAERAAKAQISRDDEIRVRKSADDLIIAAADTYERLIEGGATHAQASAAADHLGAAAISSMEKAGIDSSTHSAMLQSLKVQPEQFPMDKAVEELTGEEMRRGIKQDILQVVEEDDTFKLLDTRNGSIRPLSRPELPSTAPGGTGTGAAPSPEVSSGLRQIGAGFGGDAAVAATFNALFGFARGSDAFLPGREDAAAAANRLNNQIAGVFRAMSEGREVAPQTERMLAELPEPTTILSLFTSRQSQALEKYDEILQTMRTERERVDAELANESLNKDRASKLRQVRAQAIDLETRLEAAVEALRNDGAPSADPFFRDTR